MGKDHDSLSRIKRVLEVINNREYVFRAEQSNSLGTCPCGRIN
jgi:hypothetical protein